MIVLRIAAARLQLRVLLREDDVHRPDAEHLQLAPGGKALGNRLGDVLAERIELRRPAGMRLVDRQILRRPVRRVVRQAEHGIAGGDGDAAHARVLGGLHDRPGALHVGIERDGRRRGAWIGDGGEVDDGVLALKGPLYGVIVGDAGLDEIGRPSAALSGRARCPGPSPRNVLRGAPPRSDPAGLSRLSPLRFGISRAGSLC